MWADLFLLGYWCRLLGMPLVQIGRMDILVCHLDSGLASLHCGPVLVSFHYICSIQQMDQRQFPHPSKAKLKKGEITTSVLADDTSSTGDVGDDSSVPDLLK